MIGMKLVLKLDFLTAETQSFLNPLCVLCASAVRCFKGFTQTFLSPVGAALAAKRHVND
jgi:hypothetical protein